MFILGIDVSSDRLNIGLGKDGKLVSSLSLENPREHTALLYGHINAVLEEGEVTVKDLSCFAAVVGPGSFTGIRIAVTAVKALAYALDKDAVALNSLDLLALNASSVEGDIVASLMDGRRGNIYFSKYRRGEDGFKRVSEHVLISAEEAGDRLKDVDIILGDGVNVLKEVYPDIGSNLNILEKESWIIKPEHIVSLAFHDWNKGERENIFDLKPFYIYPKECTIRR
ncbi:MAG: tRNA (adenosine(37)-N6)-threonylcarbamoyltransferase complex dimerization subunit type 1 TsaB [Candidatus Kaelpia aquatica]|nr:tRNA (adenosine(37)-N6)-threonylcarbamoyltransferase complex dimerization subunit type 1 TsaB [Candidatus Kaelpia aquatica]